MIQRMRRLCRLVFAGDAVPCLAVRHIAAAVLDACICSRLPDYVFGDHLALSVAALGELREGAEFRFPAVSAGQR